MAGLPDPFHNATLQSISLELSSGPIRSRIPSDTAQNSRCPATADLEGKRFDGESATAESRLAFTGRMNVAHPVPALSTK